MRERGRAAWPASASIRATSAWLGEDGAPHARRSGACRHAASCCRTIWTSIPSSPFANEGAQVDFVGGGHEAGLRATTSPRLGGVYKLSATRCAGETRSGRLPEDIRVGREADGAGCAGRAPLLFHDDGRIAGDMVYDVNAGVSILARSSSTPATTCARSSLRASGIEALLHPLAREGKTVLDAGRPRRAMAAQARAQEGLATLDESQKRMLNPAFVSRRARKRGLFGTPARLGGASARHRVGRRHAAGRGSAKEPCARRAAGKGKDVMIRIITDSVASIPAVRGAEALRHRRRHALREPRRHRSTPTPPWTSTSFYADIYDMVDDIPTSSQPSQHTLGGALRGVRQGGRRGAGHLHLHRTCREPSTARCGPHAR